MSGDQSFGRSILVVFVLFAAGAVDDEEAKQEKKEECDAGVENDVQEVAEPQGEQGSEYVGSGEPALHL